MSASSLHERMIEREFAAVLHFALDLEEYPAVSVHMRPLIHMAAAELVVVWAGQTIRREVPSYETRRSLDDFSQRYVVPMVSELCGRPLLDERGRIILNPVHDMREAA